MTNGLFESLENLPQINRRKALLLKKLGLSRVIDVIFHFPRDYEDYSDIRQINQLEEDSPASVVATVADFELRSFGARKTAFYLLIEQDGQLARAVWFNQPYRAKQVSVGKRVMISGKAKRKGLRFEFMHPRLLLLDDDTESEKDSASSLPGSSLPGTLLPVYPLTEGIKQADVRRLVKELMDESLSLVEEIFPQDLLESHQLLAIQEALQKVHFPEKQSDIQSGRRRLVFQELLTLQLAIQLRKRQVEAEQSAPVIQNSSVIDSRIKRYFPYQLTAAQLKAIDELVKDMARSIPMNRMLHGDVGCGKTSVAIYAMMLAVANGYQAVLMAPTETLAQQHYQNFSKSLDQTKVSVELLTGSRGRKEKTTTIQRIETGEANLIIGTQALLQNEIQFKNLGLIIVDEQHRFGVKQRATLRQKGVTPHYLVMTATPIPRTVTMTLFGDLDVSVIDEKPPNRPKLNTYLCEESHKEKWWEFVRQKVREGRQAYVIAPLVDPEQTELGESVEQTYENLANGEFSEFKIDLVHGNQKPIEKELAMSKFARGETQILVATSVVEVGIDVPNASMMTILSASRFGLSQLHQLRGRVGRGKHAGYVALFHDSDAEDARARLQALVDIEDGFELAEVDFQMRGPGDLFGTRQHGMPPLFVADLQRDAALLEEARNAATQILETSSGLEEPRLRELRNRVYARYGKSLELADVG